MASEIFLRLGDDGALGADDLQWILYKRVLPVPMGAPLRNNDWRPISFISSTKAILMRCIRERPAIT